MSFRTSKILVLGATLAAMLVAGATALAEPPAEPLAPPAKASAAAPFVSLSGPELSGALVAANTGEIQQAVLALTRSRNPAVLAFAARMIQDHTQATREILALGESTGSPPARSAVSDFLQRQSAIQIGELSQLYGPAFDVVYMSIQVEAHRQALGLVEASLGPFATFPAFARMLSHAQGMIASHLALARAIRGA